MRRAVARPLAKDAGQRQHPVEQSVAVRCQSDPDQVVATRRDVVGEAGEPVDEVVEPSGVGAGQLVAAQSIGGGLGDDDRLPVRGQRDPVGEREIVGEEVDPAVRIAAQQSTGRRVLEEIGPPVLDRESPRGVGEVDRPVVGDRGVVAEEQPLPVEARDQLVHVAVVGIQAQQPAKRVADHEPAVGMPLEAEGAAASVADHVGHPAIRAHSQDPPVHHAGEHATVRPDEDVLGALPRDREDPQVPERLDVGGRRRRRAPDLWGDTRAIHATSSSIAERTPAWNVGTR